MRMLSILAIPATMMACTILAATPVAAKETAKQSFEHDGYTYVYSVRAAKGGQIISGKRYPGAVRFSLLVSGDTVRGTSAGKPVSFLVKDARGATGLAALETKATVMVGN